MLFGAFFASYFFLRVVANDGPWPPDGLDAPGGGRRRQHGDPDLLELHGPLGAGVDPPRQPPRDDRSASAPPGCSARPSSSSRSTSTSTSASAPATAPSARSSTASPACTAPTSPSAWCCSAFANIRAWRGHFGPEPRTPRRRGAGHLLALRRRDVDHRLHDGLHPLVPRTRAAASAPGAEAVRVALDATRPPRPPSVGSRWCLGSSSARVRSDPVAHPQPRRMDLRGAGGRRPGVRRTRDPSAPRPTGRWTRSSPSTVRVTARPLRQALCRS